MTKIARQKHKEQLELQCKLYMEIADIVREEMKLHDRKVLLLDKIAAHNKLRNRRVKYRAEKAKEGV